MAPTTLPTSLQKSLDETKVDYVNLGSSGLQISVPILGAMSFGSKQWAPWVLEEEESIKVLAAAYERGINTWDTANLYGNGRSEEIIAKAIKTLKIPRQKVVIMTKCAFHVGEDFSVNGLMHGQFMRKSKEYVNHGGLSRASIFNQVEASLSRLDTDYIDVLQIHRYDPSTPPEETMKALHNLVQAGKVRYIGASSMWTYQFANLQYVAEKNSWTKFISMQNYYNLCYREEEREMNRFCRDTGVGIIPWSPLYGGILARPVGVKESIRSKGRNPIGSAFTEADEAVVNRVEQLAKEKGWKMTHVALAWLRSKGAVPIVGVNSVERLDDAVEIRGKSLTEKEIEFLEELYVPKPIAGHF